MSDSRNRNRGCFFTLDSFHFCPSDDRIYAKRRESRRAELREEARKETTFQPVFVTKTKSLTGKPPSRMAKAQWQGALHP